MSADKLANMGQFSLAALNLDASAISLLFITICAFMLPIVYILPPVSPQKSDALLQTHSQAGLISSKSNLKRQFSSGPKTKAGQSPSVQSVMIYPIKSCKGIEVSKSKVVPQGLEFDRIFTFAQLKSPFPLAVNASGGKEGEDKWEFITLRQFARLANVTVELWLPDEMKLRKQSMRSKEVFLILRFPWKQRGWSGVLSTIAAKLTKGINGQPEMEILIPVDFPSQADIDERGYTFEDVKIWKDTVRALNLEKELPKELSLYLGVSNKLSLFRIDPAQLREVHRSAPPEEVAGYQPVAGFQDAYPLNFMNLGSVQDFSAQVPKDKDLKNLDIRRFRPNIIVNGAPAYDEESWKQVRLNVGNSGLFNPAEFAIACRTVRCKLPNVDPETGFRHHVEPDKSLRKFRNVDEGAPFSGCLGMQATPLFEDGLSEEDRETWVGVGMTIDVLERGRHVYIK